MSAKKSTKIKALTYVLGLFLLIGVVGEVVVLYAIEEPLTRLRLGLLCLAMIAWPLAVTAWRSSYSTTKDPEPPHNRIFYLLRRRVEELLREVTRLNWLVLDVNRDPRIAEQRAAEIAMVKHDLNDLLDEIIRATGRPGAKPESDAPFRERFSSAFLAIRDFAPRLEIDLERPAGPEGSNGKG
jgi:hypothetical protein